MQTRSHTRGDHIPALPFEVWAIVLSILCKTTEDFPERCRLQRVCHAFRMDEHTPLPCDKKLTLTCNIKMGLLDAMVTCKQAFANIIELNLFDSLLSRADQLALSAVSWPHLEHVNLNSSGIFDRPCALFLKKWLNTIRDAVKIVIIDLSSCHTDFLTHHYVCKWLNDTRVKYVRWSLGSSLVWPWDKVSRDKYLSYFESIVKNINKSYDDFINCQLTTSHNDRILPIRKMGTSRNLSWLLQDIRKNPNAYYCTSKAPRTTVALPECPMEQDWYMENRVKLVMCKGRTSGRGKMQIFTRESSY